MLMNIIARIELQGRMFSGCNVSDRATDWRQNYRRPDIAVFLPGTKAIVHQAHTQVGPDFVVEVCSPNDRTWEKLDFYAKVGTRELLIIDRNLWIITLQRLEDGKLREVGVSSLDNKGIVASATLPLSFHMGPRTTAPRRSSSSIYTTTGCGACPLWGQI
jgi:Uma2 family endonuclease